MPHVQIVRVDIFCWLIKPLAARAYSSHMETLLVSIHTCSINQSAQYAPQDFSLRTELALHVPKTLELVVATHATCLTKLNAYGVVLDFI
jgi:hypothetical protein